MSHLLGVVAAVLIPLVAFSVNWGLRTRLGYRLSAAADFVLAIVVFDCGALAAREAFEDQVAPQLRGDFGSLFFCYALATGLLWGWCFLRWEDRMERLYSQPVTVAHAITNLSKWSWGWVAGIVTVHVLTFLYR